jgi:hypothetical protein
MIGGIVIGCGRSSPNILIGGHANIVKVASAVIETNRQNGNVD